MHCNGNALFLEYSSKELSINDDERDAKNLYYKFNKPSNFYFRFAVSDIILTDFLHSLHTYRINLSLLQIMETLPFLKEYVDLMTVDSFSMIMPEITDTYGSEKRINLQMSPSNSTEDASFKTFL